MIKTVLYFVQAVFSYVAVNCLWSQYDIHYNSSVRLNIILHFSYIHLLNHFEKYDIISVEYPIRVVFYYRMFINIKTHL